MSIDIVKQVLEGLAEFSTATRLYALSVGGDDAAYDGLLVEAFFASDALQEVGARDIIVLSTNAELALESMQGQPATLAIALADGGRTHFSGQICEAAMLGSNGSLTRYRIRIAPWIWRLSQVRNSRVWQDKTVIEIVDEVFGVHRPVAQWR